MRNPHLRFFHTVKWLPLGNLSERWNSADSIAKGNPLEAGFMMCALGSSSPSQASGLPLAQGAARGAWAATVVWLSHKPRGQPCCLDGKVALPPFLPTKSDVWNDFLGFWKILEMTWHLVSLGKFSGGPRLALTLPGDRRKWKIGVTPQGQGTKWRCHFPSDILNLISFKCTARVGPLAGSIAQWRLIYLLCVRPWTLFLPSPDTPSFPTTSIHKKSTI